MPKIFVPSEVPKWLQLSCRFVGVASFHNKDHQGCTFTVLPALLYAWYLYMFCYILLYSGGMVMIAKKSHVSWYLDIVETCSFGLVMTARSVAAYSRKTCLKELFLELAQTDSVHQGDREKTRHTLIVTYVLFSILMPYIFYPSRTFTYFHLIHILPALVNMIDDCLAKEMLESLRHEFKAINSLLRRELEARDIRVLFPTKNLQRLGKEEALRRTKRIRELSFCHYKLVGLSKKANSSFDVSLVSASAFWMFMFIAVFFYTFLIIKHFPLRFVAGFVFYNTQWYFGVAVFIFVELRGWISVQEEAKKSSQIVHEIWNKNCGYGDIGGSTQHLRLVSTRLWHTKLEFTAKGFFPFDWTLVHTMMATISTYYVYAMQFEL